MISDAGTPAISDPGQLLIKECVNNSIDIFPVPGASSVSAGISISGFSDKYLFLGFLPEKKKDLNFTDQSVEKLKKFILIATLRNLILIKFFLIKLLIVQLLLLGDSLHF